MAATNLKPGRAMLAVVLTTLAVFGALVAGMTWQLRDRLRGEALKRESEAIHSVAMMQLAARERVSGPVTRDSIDAMLAAVLESSRLRGVLAVQLFDVSGNLRESEPVGIESGPDAPWWPIPVRQPQARFHARGSLEAVYGFPTDEGATRVPLLETVVPLQSNANASPVGFARYWIDGAAVRADLGNMDRGLLWQAGAAFCGGALIIGLVVGWSFRRLEQANTRLVERSADLARANQELDFAAKTGAIGAISAHLIHGLKNPLTGLEGFVADIAPQTNDPARGDAWRTAVDTTRRLRSLVNEVVSVLRDETTGEADYRVPAHEVLERAHSRVAAAAATAGVTLEPLPPPRDLALAGRTANLAQLVLDNLLTNAIEASPRGKCVQLAARPLDGRLEFVVRDEGVGLTPMVRDSLFRPIRSSKPGGGGIGLAISHQLARHAGGSLELAGSGAGGTTFRLIVPATPHR
jgi:signal transduction histidine kinase